MLLTSGRLVSICCGMLSAKQEKALARPIKLIKLRHERQKSREPDIVLEVGQPLPRFYQDGRPRGLWVDRIVDGSPMSCILNNGECLLIPNAFDLSVVLEDHRNA
jgi:hypothetical protein